MPSNPRTNLTAVLEEVRAGREESAERLLPLVYDELRRLAHDRMRQQAPGQTIEATALVHEAWLKMVGGADPGWNHRGHFFGAAAQAMRDILVDRERQRRSLKRGGDRDRVELSGEWLADLGDGADLLDLDGALHALEAQRPRHHRIVMLRYFAGLTVAETAKALGVSTPTVDRDWSFARAWLHQALDRGTPA